MNKVILMGRLTKEPEARHTTNKAGEDMTIARFSLAVDRRGKDAGADFISCVAFGKQGEFVEKYLKKGTKVALSGRIQTGSYTSKEGNKVYTTDVVADEIEFAESKGKEQEPQEQPEPPKAEGFIDVPDDLVDSLPFK